MTEPVQPLTWQKRTNHEEHMQFFSKINEIVGQLSGTVERSETALEQATVALAEASAAVTEANTASAAASTAASTVAGYNTRLTAAESGVAANAANIGQLDIETQDLYDRDANSVKLSADHVQIVQGGLDLRGTNRTSNTTVGTDDTQTANGHRVIQELNAYAPMVRTSGNQSISGTKKFQTLYASGYPSMVQLGQSFEGRYNEARQTIMNLVQPNDKPDTTSEFVARQIIYKGANTDETSMIFQLRSEIDGSVKTGSFGITLASGGRVIVYVTDADGTTRILHG